LAVLELLAVTFHDAPKLHTVNLADNALGTRGITVIRPLLQNARVQSWNFYNNGLAAADAETLLQQFHGSTNLTSLALGRNQMGAAGATHVGALLATLPALQEFVYDGTRPLRAGTRAICEGLAALPHPERLVRLDLHDCQIGSGEGGAEEDGCAALCQCLQNATQLQHLNLLECALEVDGLTAVLAALQTSQAALQTLELGGNGALGVPGATALRDFLSSDNSNHNHNPTCATTLTVLDFATNELGDDGVEVLVEGLAAQAQASCPVLHTLKLDCNEIEAAGAAALLRHNLPSLHTLTLTDNMDFPLGAARRLQQVYAVVEVDEELEEQDGDWNEAEDEDADASVEAEVDELGAELAGVQI